MYCTVELLERWTFSSKLSCSCLNDLLRWSDQRTSQGSGPQRWTLGSPDGVVLPVVALAAEAGDALSVEQSLVFTERPDDTPSNTHLAKHAGTVHLDRAGTGPLHAQA